MLTLGTTKHIEESLNKTVEPVHNSCQSNQVLTKLTLLLLAFYYFPLLIAAICFIIRISKKYICQKYTR